MGCIGDVSDAGSDYIRAVIKPSFGGFMTMRKEHPSVHSTAEIKSAKSIRLCTAQPRYIAAIPPVEGNYTINGRFSNVPSATRTLTSIIIKTESGVRAALLEKISESSRWLVLTDNLVIK